MAHSSKTLLAALPAKLARKDEKTIQEELMRRGLAFLAGAGAGAAIALLYAPQSGEKTQKLIAKKVHHGMNQVTATGRKMQDQARDLAAMIEQEKKRVAHAFEAGVEAYEA